MYISRDNWSSLLSELHVAQQNHHLVTYRALLERLDIPAPALRTLALALEHLAELDAEAGRPLRSALVISQGASRMPRTGFFECANRLGRFSGSATGAAAASWHAAEVARVFECEYPHEA